MQHIERKIQDSVISINQHLGSASDIALNFYDMTCEERDKIVSANVEIRTSDKCILGVKYQKKDNLIQYHYNSESNRSISQNIMNKAMSHEVRHVNQCIRYKNFHSIHYSKPYVWAHKALSSSVYSTISPFIAVGTAFGALLYDPALLLLNAPIGMLGITRLRENGADDFSNRMIPEIKHEALAESYRDNGFLTLEDQINRKIENSKIMKFFHLFEPHPSNYSRNKQSEQNCPLYLQEKKRLGIPSLFVPE